MEVDFCVLALEGALAKYDTPDIFNTDQGNRFTNFIFTRILRRMASSFLWMAVALVE